MDRTEKIFGNEMSAKTVRRANHSQQRFIRRFGDDRQSVYHLALQQNEVIGSALGVQDFVSSPKAMISFPQNPLVVGNIRMGFGHYRISMAIASAAHSMGYTPLWLDFNSFTQTTGGKVIAAQNNLYSLGSRLSQQFYLFNKLVWDPMNSEGFRKLSYNAVDQRTTELMTPILRDLPRDIPYVATHVWPAQAAVHAGFTHVVNAVPDNWPMALHLAEGSVHTVQTPSGYVGYRALCGMDKKRLLNPMPAKDLYYTGHYVDHELVDNIEVDCDARLQRAKNREPRRYLLTVGGAGAQKEIFVAIIRTLLPALRAGRATLLVNVGDHRDVWQQIIAAVPQINPLCHFHFNDFAESSAFARDALTGPVEGVHVFWDNNIFAAVYNTNLLMRACDVLITKPSELSFYPVPKLFIKRVGGHEAWGAIHSAEVGDGSYECDTLRETQAVLRLFQQDDSLLAFMCAQIRSAKAAGIYNGAYRVVKLATR